MYTRLLPRTPSFGVYFVHSVYDAASHGQGAGAGAALSASTRRLWVGGAQRAAAAIRELGFQSLGVERERSA
eukprot:6214374-Pleurochrysis_carterae.AAC.1